jgi:SPP1 family predicted phage head-tail adaptor
MDVNIGELNKRIDIISITTEDNENGFPIPKETVFYSCWAKYSQTSGTELTKADADFSDVKCRFLIRYTPKEITRKMFVKYKGKNYNIAYLNEYGDSHEFIEIWCELKEVQ